MTGLRVGDVVKVPFPYTDRPVREHRPALVVAMPTGQRMPSLLWVLMITSAANRGWPGDVVVSDLGAAGLPVASVIRTEKIATIDARDAVRLGILVEADWAQVSGQLSTYLAATVEG